LTTAATVWITAALGIACGLAAWSTVGLTVVLAILILVAGPWVEQLFSHQASDHETNRQN